MRIRSFLLMLAIMAAACNSNIQTLYLKSDQVKFNSSRELIFENDTLAIRYSFFSENGLIQFSVLNKLSQPLYVHWDKSSFILNTQYMNYWQDRTVTNGYVYQRWFAPEDFFALRGPYMFLVSKRDVAIEFIPPNAQLAQAEFIARPGKALSPGQMLAKARGQEDKIKVTKSKKMMTVEYEKPASPLVFRNYLSISLDKDGNNMVYLDHEFFVQKIIEAPVDAYFPNSTLVEGEKTMQHFLERGARMHDTSYVGPHMFALKIPAERGSTTKLDSFSRTPVKPTRSAREIGQ